MLIAGIDFEATGVEPNKARITEIGAVIWESSSWTEIGRLSCLVYSSDYPEQSQEVIRVTGITDDILKKDGQDPVQSLKTLAEFISGAEYLIAHNKAYDRTLMEAEWERLEISQTFPDQKWICSYQDVPYPEYFRCKQLSHLALDHGVPIDPSKLHRAVEDVALISELMIAGSYTVEQIVKYIETPWIYLQASVPAPWTDNGVGVAKAKERGYGWEKARFTDGPVFSKLWVKRVKKNLVEKEVGDAPFKVNVIREENGKWD